MVLAKTYDAGTPHLRLLAGQPFEQPEERKAVSPFRLIGDAIQKIFDTIIIHSGFDGTAHAVIVAGLYARFIVEIW